MRDVTRAELWLVRHAQSEGNVADDAARGAHAERLDLDIRDPDVPLSAVGKEQALALGRSWQSLEAGSRPTRLLSSPYERARQTALVAVEAAGWDIEVEPDERLRERDLGMLDGYTRYGVEARFPEEAERRDRLAVRRSLLSERLEVDDVVGYEDSPAGEGGFEDHRVVLGREAYVFGDSDAVDAEHSESFGDAGREHLVEEQRVRLAPATAGVAHPASRPCSRSQRRRA